MVEFMYNLVQSLLYSAIVYFMAGFDINIGEELDCVILSHWPCGRRFSHIALLASGCS